MFHSGPRDTSADDITAYTTREVHLVVTVESVVSCCCSVVSFLRKIYTTLTSTDVAKTSHTRTVVRECCKGDDASQWENGKFDPLPRPNSITDHQQKLRT